MSLLDELNSLSTKELVRIVQKFQIDSKHTRAVLIEKIYERYCEIKKYVSYSYVKQLGHEGKDGRTFLALDEHGKEIAIKIFRKNKKGDKIQREADLQQIAARHGISPNVIEINTDGKYIVMDKLDENLYDLFRKQNGQLTREQQVAILNLFTELDKCGVFHGDPNPLNFMKKNGKWYAIDFGFARKIDSKVIKKYGTMPNRMYMTIGFKLQLERVYAQCKLEYFDKFIETFKKWNYI